MTPDTPGDRSHISIGFTKTQLTKNVNFIIDDTHAEIEFGLAQVWDSKCNGMAIHLLIRFILKR